MGILNDLEALRDRMMQYDTLPQACAMTRQDLEVIKAELPAGPITHIAGMALYVSDTLPSDKVYLGTHEQIRRMLGLCVTCGDKQPCEKHPLDTP